MPVAPHPSAAAQAAAGAALLPVLETMAPAPERRAAASLRPVVGRRHREPLCLPDPPPAQTDWVDDGAAEEAPDDDPGDLDPQTPRGQALGLFLLMLVCLGAAAVGAWRLSPPTYLVRASVMFQNLNGEPLTKNQAFFEEREALLLSDRVREAALKRLSPQKNHSEGTVDPGFLTRPGGLRAVGSLSWEAPANRPAIASLVLRVRSSAPGPDATRLSALVQAFSESQTTPPRSEVADLKLNLLQNEVDELRQEVTYRNHNREQTRREIQALENTMPSQMRLDLMQAREASLRAALGGAIEARVLAEMSAAPAAMGSHGPPTRPTTAPSGPGFRPEQSPLAPSQGPTGVEERLKQARSRESELQADLAVAIRESLDAQARSERLMAERDKLGGAQGELPQLELKLKQKSKELAAMKIAAAGVREFPPDDARVAGTEDPRGLNMAAAIGGVAIVFGLLMVAATRRGDELAKKVDET